MLKKCRVRSLAASMRGLSWTCTPACLTHTATSCLCVRACVSADGGADAAAPPPAAEPAPEPAEGSSGGGTGEVERKLKALKKKSEEPDPPPLRPVSRHQQFHKGYDYQRDIQLETPAYEKSRAQSSFWSRTSGT